MNFWSQLPGKPKTEIETLLTKQLGKPNNELNADLCQEIVKKITSYYANLPEQNYTTYSLVGYLTEIVERKFKEGPKRGQTYYVLKLGGAGREVLQARQEDLPQEKWEQIKNLALLGQNLVFKYKKYFTNRQIIDFYPPQTNRHAKPK